MKYKVVHAYTEDEFIIEAGDDGIITACDKPGPGKEGMDWVKMMTEPYGAPALPILQRVTALTHVIIPEKDDEVSKDFMVDIEKKDDDKRQIFGWAYVLNKDGEQVIDRSGEFVKDVEELEKAGYRFVMESRTQGDQHRRVGVGTMIESMVITPEKIEKLGLPEGSLPTGWWVGFQVNEEDWDEVKKRRQFSIHGKGLKKAVLS